jgi:glycosyltransferase involved in cell wall biosynthesis
MKVDYSKIIVAHPGRQHSFRVAEALEKNGMLFKYATTVYDSDKSFLMKLAKKFLHGDELNRANKRKMASVDDDKILQFYEFEGLILLLVRRIDKKRKFTMWLEKHISVGFQKSLAKYIIKNNVGVVISYDCNSSVLFDILQKKAPQVIKIIDDAHPNRNYLYKVYNENLKSSKEFVKTYEACGYLLDKNVADTFGDESKKADLHIVASEFSKQSVKFNGFSDNQIIVAPYGVNNVAFKPLEKKYDNGLKVLFVGEINQRKGIVQILDTAKELSHLNIEFNLVGLGKEYHEELYVPYEDYVNFRGRVSFEDLQMYYGTSHIFVFPSMGEGFGLVLLEALSAGLPIVTSKNCGGPDIITEGYNGFTIDAGNTQELKEKILWFYNHMELLPQMQENAIESIKNRSWDDYERTLVSQLKEKIKVISFEKTKNQND